MEVERSLPMGANSKLNVSERREAVLSLLRREEPAGVLARGAFWALRGSHREDMQACGSV